MAAARAGLALLGAAVFTLVGVGAPGAWAKETRVRPVGLERPLSDERLSNETTLTRHAYVVSQSRIRHRPLLTSRTIGRLRFQTEDGPPEVYPVLRSHVDRHGRTWLKIRVPGRPNGRKGWVAREALGGLVAVHTALRIDRRTLRATLRRNGRVIWSSPVGVGKPSTPTPAGRFWIRTRLHNFHGGGVYGRWAFGTSAYSRLTDWPGGGVVGVHGTNQPQLIPGRPSHGCVRVPNANVVRLARLMPIGTPVRIV